MQARAQKQEQGAGSSPLVALRPREVSLVGLMRMTREEWDVYTRGSAMRRAGYEGLKRNVAVALGNWLARTAEPPTEAIDALRDALGEGELIAEHARWALEQAGTRAGTAARDA